MSLKSKHYSCSYLFRVEFIFTFFKHFLICLKILLGWKLRKSQTEETKKRKQFTAGILYEPRDTLQIREMLACFVSKIIPISNSKSLSNYTYSLHIIHLLSIPFHIYIAFSLSFIKRSQEPVPKLQWLRF